MMCTVRFNLLQFFFSSRRRHTRCALVTGVQTCALPIYDLGWRIGSQAYTFRLFTLEEALGKLNTLGLKYVELYPGQKIGAGLGDETTNHNASPETIQKLKQLLKSKGIQPVCYGVVNGKKNRKSVV